jgi:hypothetical protein
MPKEAQPLSFKEIKNGTPENYSSYCTLTPEALQQIQTLVGKQIELTNFKEDWYYEGEDEGDDHSTSDTFVTGILIKVDERTIGIQVSSGKTQHSDGSSTEHKESYMEFPFYSDGCAFRRAAGNSHISSFTVDGQTFELSNAGNEEKMEIIEPTPFLDANKGDIPYPNVEYINAFQRNKRKLEENNSSHDSDSKPQPSSFEEIKQGSPEDYRVERKLMPDLFRQIQSQIGKEVHVSFENERWVYTGPDDEDHSTSKTYIRGTVTRVDERTIEVGNINYGWTEYDSGELINCIGKKMTFPFHQEQFKLRTYAEILHIQTLTLRGQTFEWERDALKPITQYIIWFDNGDDMQAGHGELVNIPDGEDPWEFALNYLQTHISPGPNGILLDDVRKLKPGEKFRNM